MMTRPTKKKAIERLQKLLDKIPKLKKLPERSNSPEFKSSPGTIFLRRLDFHPACRPIQNSRRHIVEGLESSEADL